jgi:polyribonucleotide nucleotidyltransferase
MARACQIVRDLTTEAEIGKTYKGKVVTIKDFGLFVAFLNVQGLCHISEIAHERVNNIDDYFKEGDEIEVKVLEIDRNGKIRLSRKALLGAPVAQ